MKFTLLVACGLSLALMIMPQIAIAEVQLRFDDLPLQEESAARAAKSPEEAEVLWRKVIQLYPNYDIAHYELGNALYDQNKLDEAITKYRKALELNLKYADAYYSLGKALYIKGNLDEAIAQYRKVIELNPKYINAYYNLGNALYDQKKLDEAIAQYRKAIEIDPKFAAAYYELGNALYDQKKLDEAITQYRKAIEIDPKFAEAYYNLGNALNNQKKLDEAIAQYRKAIEIDPKFAAAYYELGNALYDQKKLDEAIIQYRKAIEINPKYVDAYNNLGIALKDQKKLDEAIIQYRKAIEINPKYANTYNNLGIALKDQKKLDEAIIQYRKAIEINPKHAKAYNNLGYTLDDQNKPSEAIIQYRKAIELDPQLFIAYFNLSKLLFDQKKPDEAIILVRKVLSFPDMSREDKSTTNHTLAHIVIGSILHNQGKSEDAIVEYQKAIKLDPKYVDGYKYLGDALKYQKKLGEAIAQYQKAIELDPKFVGAYIGFGDILHKQKKTNEAIKLFRSLLSLPDFALEETSTSHTLAYVVIGLLLQDQGKLAEAIIEFKKADEIDPNLDFVQNNLKEAQRLLALQQRPEQVIALNDITHLDFNEPLTLIKRSIVKVSVVFQGNAKGTSYGTGYVIKRQGDKVWIITNRHVVLDSETKQQGDNLEVEPYYGNNVPKELSRSRSAAKIVNMTMPNEKLDLALLEVTGLPPDIQPLPIHKGKINFDTAILIIGHSNSKDWATENGRFLNIDDDGNLVVSANLTVGSSGSPALNSEKQVIGLMFRTSNGSQINNSSFGFVHDIKVVMKQLEKWGITTP